MNATEAADRLIAEAHPIEDRGDVEAALALYQRAVHVAPDYFRAHMNVGNSLLRLDRIDEAVAAQRRAVACAPNYAAARFNLGSVLRIRGDLDAAEAELREALRLQPDMLAAAVVLADLCEERSSPSDAEAMFARALAIAPLHAATLFNFGMFYLRQHRLDEALDCFARAKVSDPGLKDVESFILFTANLRSDLDPIESFELHRRLGQAIQNSAGAPLESWSNSPDWDRPLRVGYVSADFRSHPVAHFICPVLQNHDRKHFESFCYSNSSERGEVADVLRACSQHWLDVAALGDEQLADRIRRDGIDLLVDLGGHTTNNRLRVFARHPAPVQVTWLGYLNTSGLTAMDYRICDRHTDPEGVTERFHTERVVRLPHSQWCYAPWAGFENLSVSPRERRAQVVFGSFNQYVKITDECLGLWCQVLARVPDALLTILDVRDPQAKRRLLSRFERHGIDAARITTRGRLGFADYFAAIQGVDIALDTHPYNGVTTTFDTLWMGAPVVALRGERAISRGCYSILRELELDELIAHDAKAYVDVNIRLASDAEWCARLHHSLRPRLVNSPLMNPTRFVSDLEVCYRQLWRNWCSGPAAAEAGRGT